MKQFQINYEKEFGFATWLQQIRTYCQEHSISKDAILFRIYSDSVYVGKLAPVLSRIRDSFPEAPYAGSTTFGNIIHGSLVDSHISVTCTIFEGSSSRVQVLQVPLSYESQSSSADLILNTIHDSPWVKAVELMTVPGSADMAAFCDRLSSLPDSVQIYGGGAHSADTDTSRAFVFSSAGNFSNHAAVFILLGGSSLQIRTQYLSGWQKLGKPFTVTAARDNLLLELNGKPAFEVYEHYLNIPKDERFFRLTNVFPLSFDAEDVPFLRVVAASPDDRILRLAGPIRNGSSCYINYGDPLRILDCLRNSLEEVRAFSPQVIQLFSCAARKMFWGSDDVSRETFPFESLALTSGYYTSGEFLRTKKDILLHNSTLVIVTMREGDPSEPPKDYSLSPEEISMQLIVSNCLASFIVASTEE